MLRKNLLNRIEKLVISMTILISLLAIYGWFSGIYRLLSISPEGATMKFNTALVFFISGIFLTSTRIKGKAFSIIHKILPLIVILIGGLTIGAYVGLTLFPIDNLFAADNFSKQLPGRMSPATAFCSVLMGISFYGDNASGKFTNQIGLYSANIIAITSFLGIISFILMIPSSNKTPIFQSMAIPTSTLFFSISVLQMLKNQRSLFSQIMIGNSEGSKLTRKIIPLIIIFPVVSIYFLITGIHKNIISWDFGLVAYTVLFITLCIIYVAFIALGLNKTDNERLRLEKNLRQSNLDLIQFKQGLDQVSIVALTDNQGVITYVNETFCKISQYSKEELIGKTHAIINSGHHSKQFFTKMWKTISSGEIWVDEIKNRAKDGSFYWVLTAIVPFKNKNDIITEYMALRQDITERKKAEEIRLAYVEKLEYKNKELEQFAYVASHDLQEPLRTIINFSDLLAKKRTDHFDEIGLKSIQFIQEASVRMSQLIKSLLDYNQIDKNEKLSIVDCNKLLHEIEIDLSKVIKETGATLKLENLPPVIGHETPLRMLFQNLISNGIKFQKNGTKPQITIKGNQNDSEWIFSVKDNGIGISPEHHEKIFVIFQRLHNKEKYNGSGIGLSHCRKIVDLHGGKIWVESQLNEGSIFHFTIRTKKYVKENKLHSIN